MSSGNAHYIAINNLLFPSEQVQVYISSKRTDEPNKPTATGTFGNPTVAYDEPETIEQFREALAAANAKIVDLDSQLTQARVDFEQAIINNKALYTTPAINIMNAVITEFWINYHPDQPAPKQSTITKWIIDNFDGISDALALNIDKVCRHSDARSGGKYKR